MYDASRGVAAHPRKRYSLKCLEGAFSELPLYGVLGTSPLRGSRKFPCVAFSKVCIRNKPLGDAPKRTTAYSACQDSSKRAEAKSYASWKVGTNKGAEGASGATGCRTGKAK